MVLRVVLKCYLAFLRARRLFCPSSRKMYALDTLHSSVSYNAVAREFYLYAIYIYKQSLMWGLISLTVRSWPELKPRVGHLTNWATHVPVFYVVFKKMKLYRTTWVVQSIKHLLVSAQVMISRWVQALHWTLCWQHRACLGFSLSLSLWSSPTHSLSQNK